MIATHIDPTITHANKVPEVSRPKAREKNGCKSYNSSVSNRYPREWKGRENNGYVQAQIKEVATIAATTQRLRVRR